MNLSSDWFINNFLWSKTLAIVPKNGKRNWVSALVKALLSSEMHYLSIGQGLTLSPMENYQVLLEIFWAVYLFRSESKKKRKEPQRLTQKIPSGGVLTTYFSHQRISQRAY